MKKKKPTPEQNMYLWDNFESNWDIRKRRDQSRTDILSKNGWEFFKVNVRHQTADVGSSENTKQNLYRKKLHLGISYSSFRKPKTKRNSWKNSGGKKKKTNSSMEKELHRTFCQNPWM